MVSFFALMQLNCAFIMLNLNIKNGYCSKVGNFKEFQNHFL